MCRASQEIIAGWKPETFAEGLWRAVDAAQAAPEKVYLRWTQVCSGF